METALANRVLISFAHDLEFLRSHPALNEDLQNPDEKRRLLRPETPTLYRMIQRTALVRQKTQHLRSVMR